MKGWLDPVWTPRAVPAEWFYALQFVGFLLVAGGCARTPPPDQAPPARTQQIPASEQGKNIASPDTVSAPGQDAPPATCPDERTIRQSERDRANCYHLQPGVTVTKKKGPSRTGQALKGTKKKGQKPTATAVKTKQKKGQPAGTKAVAGKKKSKTTTVQSTVPTQKDEYQTTTGRCQPQSLIYARCRTGIKTCRLGDTSPVQWFACAQKNGATTSTPIAGSVMVLAVNSRRGMPTGHPMYVEEVKANKDGTWTLRITHTNYDRKCHLDLDARVLYDPKQMTAAFQSGPWSTWAKDLKTLGFILR